MNAQEIAVRQEIRQLLAEAGINKETIKDFAKQCIQESVNKGIKQAYAELDTETLERIARNEVKSMAVSQIRNDIRGPVENALKNMKITIEIPGLSQYPVPQDNKNG